MPSAEYVDLDVCSPDNQEMAAQLLLCFLVLVVSFQSVPITGQLIFDNPSNLPYTYGARITESGTEECPSEQEIASVINEIGQEVQRLLFPCGGTSGWTHFAHLDMTNSSQQCPTGLTEHTFDGMRVCGRPNNNPHQSCTSTVFQGDGTQYTEVCGKVMGYLFADMQGFAYYRERGASATIDDYYVDGITLTHGAVGSREHIWTFAAATSHDDNYYQCPCAPGETLISTDPPPFVGDEYFCESAVTTWPGRATGNVFYNVTLWDGEGCPESNSCECTLNDPPYFATQLSASTTDGIEMRFCSRYALNDGTDARGGILVQFIDLYVK